MRLVSPKLWLDFLSKNSSKIYSQRPNAMTEPLHWPSILGKPSSGQVSSFLRRPFSPKLRKNFNKIGQKCIPRGQTH